VRLDPAGRSEWASAALSHLQLPLTPPQIDLFRAGA
jgi:hypothetical protein